MRGSSTSTSAPGASSSPAWSAPRSATTHAGRTLPVVLIGHSKTYTRLNERLLEPFLEHVAARPDRFQFATFRDTLEVVTNLAA